MIISPDILDKIVSLEEKLGLKYKVIYIKTEDILKINNVDDLIPTNDKTIHSFIYVLTDTKEKNLLVTFSEFEKWKKKLL